MAFTEVSEKLWGYSCAHPKKKELQNMHAQEKEHLEGQLTDALGCADVGPHFFTKRK